MKFDNSAVRSNLGAKLKTDLMKLLGIGSRIVHPEYGKGVVVNVSSRHYWVSFMDSGLETINLDSE